MLTTTVCKSDCSSHDTTVSQLTTEMSAALFTVHKLVDAITGSPVISTSAGPVDKMVESVSVSEHNLPASDLRYQLQHCMRSEERRVGKECLL